jgi:cytoskeleton-associated protein 5
MEPPPTPTTSKTKSFGLKRPVSTLPKPVVASESTDALSSAPPFIGASVDAKKARLAKDGSRWVLEPGATRKDLTDVLNVQMEANASRELVVMLFSHDHNAINDHIAGLNVICEAYSAAAAGEDFAGIRLDDLQAILLANFDLPLKYVSLKVHEPQPNLISKCLETLETVLSFLTTSSYVLTDAEAFCFVPTIIHKVNW